MLCELISKRSGTEIMTSPGLKHFSAINPRPVSTKSTQNQLVS